MDRRRLRQYRQRHDTRRSMLDPLADRTHPHWLVTATSRAHCGVRAVADWGGPCGAVLARTMDRLTAEGLDHRRMTGGLGNFFSCRDGERRFVHLRPTDPTVPLYGPSWHPACPSLRGVALRRFPLPRIFEPLVIRIEEVKGRDS